MPRLFTAIEVPAVIGADLSMLRGGLAGARWIDPENYHVTLRFIGDVDDTLGADILSMLGQIRRHGFDLSLEGLGQFGGNRPRAVFAAVKAIPALLDLQAEQERIMQRLGFSADRAYKPHVTLARLREASSRQVADYLSMHGGYRSATFHVPRFVVLSSRDSVGGGPYVLEAAYPLEHAPL